MICRRRPGSPQMVEGTSAAEVAQQLEILFAGAHGKRLQRELQHVAKSKSISSRSIFPASIFEKSRISFDDA